MAFLGQVTFTGGFFWCVRANPEATFTTPEGSTCRSNMSSSPILEVPQVLKFQRNLDVGAAFPHSPQEVTDSFSPRTMTLGSAVVKRCSCKR